MNSSSFSLSVESRSSLVKLAILSLVEGGLVEGGWFLRGFLKTATRSILEGSYNAVVGHRRRL